MSADSGLSHSGRTVDESLWISTNPCGASTRRMVPNFFGSDGGWTAFLKRLNGSELQPDSANRAQATATGFRSLMAKDGRERGNLLRAKDTKRVERRGKKRGQNGPLQPTSREEEICWSASGPLRGLSQVVRVGRGSRALCESNQRSPSFPPPSFHGTSQRACRSGFRRPE